jgi:hypothetical protein
VEELTRRAWLQPRAPSFVSAQSSANAATVRQFRAVTVVGSRRFVSASMSFDRPCPFGTLT